MDRIDRHYFQQDPITCARGLIGCHFRWNGCEGKIVETEAYLEHGDPACHTWNRPSSRDFLQRSDAGTAYVYLNYGVHWLFNVVVKGGSDAGFVLFRALEPTQGVERMRQRRGDMPESQLCSGPGKLTKALEISGSDHGAIFLEREKSGIFQGPPINVLSGPRIGISRAADFLWRFGAEGSLCLSRKFQDGSDEIKSQKEENEPPENG
jgi:DNA-3-methyladenine glycosylase